jgi:lysyl-tRNA synthetase, class II
VAVLGASDRLSDTYRQQGLSVMYHGDEAVIDAASFTLAGGKMRAVRQACSRVERRGYDCQVVYAGELSETERAELRQVERRWLDGRPRKGFTMEFDDLFRQNAKDAVFVIARGPDGRIAGFLHLSVCRAGSTLSLSSMPRLRDVPNGLTSWLIVKAVTWASENDLDHVSLNFSPFARLLVDQAELPLTSRLGRRALLNIKKALSLQLDNLLQFNSQFRPRFQPRFIVYERRTDLPLVAIAAMAGEGYLPFSGLVCGSTGSAKHQERSDDLPDLRTEEFEPITTSV